MAQFFDLTKIVNSTNRKFQKPTASKKFTIDYQALSEYRKYPKKVWFGFSFALISSIILSTIIIEQSNIASYIMSRVRLQEKQTQKIIPSDVSSISIKASKGMVALVTLPTGERVGIDHQQTRFFEYPFASMTKTQASINWELFIQRPPSGIYQLDLSVTNSGPHSLQFNSLDTTGYLPAEFTFQTSFSSDQIIRYHFSYDKTNPNNVKFTDVQTLSIQ
jgi:hypothetical protein